MQTLDIGTAMLKTQEPQTHEGMAKPSSWVEVQRHRKAFLWDQVLVLTVCAECVLHCFPSSWMFMAWRLFLRRVDKTASVSQLYTVNRTSLFICNPASLFGCMQ